LQNNVASNRTLDPVDNPERPRSKKPYSAAVRVVTVVATALIVALACRSLLNHVRKSSPVEATSTDPAIAVRQERVVHGVSWGLSYEAALEQGEAEGTPVLVYFTAVNDPYRIQFETGVLADQAVSELLSQFITVELYEDYVPIGSLSMPAQTQLARTNAGHSTEYDRVDRGTVPHDLDLARRFRHQARRLSKQPRPGSVPQEGTGAGTTPDEGADAHSLKKDGRKPLGSRRRGPTGPEL
jgi:hypothetical protein